MSRIGKAIIKLPAGVDIKVSTGNVVTVKGPKGELTQKLEDDISLDVTDGIVELKRPTEQKRHKALHGLYRSLVNNMITGVTQGYTKRQELVGVGYKAAADGNILDLTLGYSHHIYFEIPKELTVKTEQDKGKNPIVTLEGIDKQLIGQVAAKIRSLRAPEPYKGKGIKFVGETLRRKAGKTASK
ncbi:MAG: 50S ribosomal protein L6 [Bacteroidia bacterium]|nr:50S ribosomal protein L6 [Bacteroidia bacterium]MCF8427805.1 50S ribosomal protein L6 [Bacteroidia bacterium]MCF8446043.1 50S ribosomal protein L6 [Bacteroidia bacterium]